MGGPRTPFYVDIMAYHQEVTGSCNFLSVKYPDGKTEHYLVDFGLFQENEYLEDNYKIPFSPEKLDAVFVTHNHIDHVGRLPLLTKRGYYKEIYMSDITAKLIRHALLDSHKVIKTNAKRNNEKPIYNDKDVSDVLSKIVPCRYQKKIQINDNVVVRFLNNGHLLGSAMILFQISYPGQEDINILFTGDYNNKNLFFNVSEIPEKIKKMPLTIVQESTYGNMNADDIQIRFAKNLEKAIDQNKIAILPVFSLGRAQEILYHLKLMQKAGVLSTSIPICFDGKLAFKYTNIYIHAHTNIKKSMKDFLPENLIYVSDYQRPEIIKDTEPKIVVTTSGMGTYGPAQIYLSEYLSNPNVLIHFTGYVAEGTLGKKLKETPVGETVQVAGLIIQKRAQVEYTKEFSTHAKGNELLDFLKKFSNIKLILVNHGSLESKEIFADRVRKEINTDKVGILGRDYLYRINHFGLVKSMSTKF